MVELFYSYAHEDEELRAELEMHLSMRRRRGLITGWYDRRIDAGSEWKAEIDIKTFSRCLALDPSGWRGSGAVFQGARHNRASPRYRKRE